MEEDIYTPNVSEFIYETPENHALVEFFPNGSLANPVERAAWDMYWSLLLAVDCIDPQETYVHEQVHRAIELARGGYEYMKVCQCCGTTVCYGESGKEYVNHGRSPFLCPSCLAKVNKNEN